MIHAYAIEPACALAWCDRRLFGLVSSWFGLGKPRLLLELPQFSSWKRAAYQAAEAAGLPQRDQTRLTELFKLLGETRIRRKGTHYDGTRTWLENAETEYGRHPFAAIIATGNPRAHAAVLLEPDAGNERDPLWNRPRAETPTRTPQALALAVAALVENCGELHLVDPHFGPEASRWRKVVEEILRLVGRRKSGLPGNICLHCSAEAELAFFEREASALASRIPAGITLHFKRWEERPGGEKFHNRYLISDIGGVIFGVGLDSGDPGETDDLNLMDLGQFLRRRDQILGTPRFRLVDEPKPVVGTKP